MTNLFALEEKMVPYEKWGTCGAPSGAVKLATEESDSRVPTGIAHDDILGWVVLQSSGQGPYLIWQEGQPFPPSVREESNWVADSQGPYLIPREEGTL